MPNPKANFYFNQPSQWQEELILLRSIISRMDVTEEVKWGKPCYTHGGRNIVLLHYFKDFEKHRARILDGYGLDDTYGE